MFRIIEIPLAFNLWRSALFHLFYTIMETLYVIQLGEMGQEERETFIYNWLIGKRCKSDGSSKKLRSCTVAVISYYKF